MRNGQTKPTAISGETRITPFMVATIAAFFAAVIVGWMKGGHAERLGVAVILSSYLASGLWRSWIIGDVHVDVAITDALVLLFLGWLTLWSDRWWPFVATAAMALTVLVHIVTIVTDISWNAAVSARIGLKLLGNLTLLAGVAERWAAGEEPVSAGLLWRRRARPAP